MLTYLAVHATARVPGRDSRRGMCRFVPREQWRRCCGNHLVGSRGIMEKCASIEIVEPTRQLGGNLEILRSHCNRPTRVPSRGTRGDNRRYGTLSSRRRRGERQSAIGASTRVVGIEPPGARGGALPTDYRDSEQAFVRPSLNSETYQRSPRSVIGGAAKSWLSR